MLFRSAAVVAASLPTTFWLTVNEKRWVIKSASARYPAIPLCPLLDAKSAAVLPPGKFGVGSSTAPGDAPSLISVMTVSSLEKGYEKNKDRPSVQSHQNHSVFFRPKVIQG